jgi:hypothetical protein
MFSMATGLPRLTAASTRRKEDRTDSVDPATRTPGVFFLRESVRIAYAITTNA